MTLFFDNRRSGQTRGQRGASLIEVLVALVLLVIGIYSIARLFPGGFFSIRGAQDATFADRLAQGQLEQLKENSGFLLDAVYMYTPTDVPGLTPATPFDPSVSPTDYNNDYPNVQNPNPYYNDINKARFISGETFKVGAPNVSANLPATNGVSLYFLNDGPAVLNNGALAEPAPQPASTTPVAITPANVYGLPPVRSGPWTARLGAAPSGINEQINSGVNSGYGINPGAYDQPSDLLASGGAAYAIDYSNEQIALPPQTLYAQPFTFVIKQSWTIPNANPNLPATTEIVTYYYPLLIPKSNTTYSADDTTSIYNGGWFNPVNGENSQTPSYLDTTRAIVTDVPPPNVANSNATLTGWVPGSAQLIRTMTQEANPGTLTGTGMYANPNEDPYTYALATSGSNMDSVDDALTGATLGVLALNPRLQGQTVSVSYLAYDWHVIHEDDDVPASDGNAIPSPIHLTIDHLKRLGDVQSDQSLYPGLFHSADVSTTANVMPPPPYDIVVLDTDTGQSIGLSAPTAGATGGAVYDLDNNNANNTPIQNGQFAVSYQNGYVTLPTAGGLAATSAWTSVSHQHVRIYYEGDNDWAVALQKGPSLYVQGSSGALEVGQYAVVASGNTVHLQFPPCDQGQTVEIDDVRYTDNNNVPQSVSTVTGTIATDYADTHYIDLGALLPNVNTADIIQIGAVRGVSVRSVVIWKERDQWRSRTVNTILTGNGNG